MKKNIGKVEKIFFGDFSEKTFFQLKSSISQLKILIENWTFQLKKNVFSKIPEKIFSSVFPRFFSFRKKSVEKNIFNYIDPKFSQESKNHT